MDGRIIDRKTAPHRTAGITPDYSLQLTPYSMITPVAGGSCKVGQRNRGVAPPRDAVTASHSLPLIQEGKRRICFGISRARGEGAGAAHDRVVSAGLPGGNGATGRDAVPDIEGGEGFRRAASPIFVRERHRSEPCRIPPTKIAVMHPAPTWILEALDGELAPIRRIAERCGDTTIEAVTGAALISHRPAIGPFSVMRKFGVSPIHKGCPI